MTLPPIDPSAAAARLLAKRAAATNFLDFVRTVMPKYTLAPFQIELINALNALENGTLGKNNLLITMPPRHGKSWIASTLFPAYYMARNPERHTLAVSYGAELASTFGRAVRDLCLEPLISQIFPALEMSKTSSAVDDWMTTDGGKYYACGVNGGTTGRAANLLLIDDPIKNRLEADSPSTRNKLWNYYNSSLVNRKQPTFSGEPAIEVLIQTRWHPDDLAGRIMQSDDWEDGDWHHINFTALTTRPATIPDPADPTKTIDIQENTTLWPERFGLEYMAKMQRRDPREFAALYQQEPYILGGNLIKAQWFNTYRKPELPERFQSIIMTVDPAVTTKTISDYSVIMTLGLDFNGDIYILNVERERLDYPSLKRKLIQCNSVMRGKGLRGIYIENISAGLTLIQDLRSTPGLSVLPYNPGYARGKMVDKVARVQSILPMIEGGRVFIPEDALWLDEFLEETQAFPNAKHDDQVDALSMGLDILSHITVAAAEYSNMPDLSGSLNNMSVTSQFDAMFHNPRENDRDIRHTARSLSTSFKNFKPLGEL